MPEALARALEFMSYVRVSSSFDSNIGVVEPDIRSKTNAGVMVGRTLVETSGGEVSVVVANFSREPQKIKEGELLGLCQEVDHEWHQWKVCKRSVVKEDDNLPDHVHDLFLRSCQCLDDSQVSPLRELLMEFADIFSTSDLDLGCTDMVEHSIDTGDHRPIKQPARRMAPAQWQEMEKVKKNIRSQGVIEKSSSPWTSAVVLVRKKDGSTFDQELERLSEVFNRIRAAHLKLNPQEVSLVSEGSEVPGTYCRRFVKDFASIAAPLHKLLGKRQKFEWTAVTQKAFDELHPPNGNRLDVVGGLACL
ncbi:hypothetical protein Pcinc_011255 [Petrolisthes cinctipes]|uniref:Reverse transcriptase/retrotransposon-derived protein RNase H-like domain-containing protein n=1 Tax=Petrolisthes cinctipes TaxID=88211 RepID=A0AAE1G344_PETCI|nr:hypothetical protein Pcinc_011255 [Petrolisthes cinctipes]